MWISKQGLFQLPQKYSSCFNSTQILSSSSLGQEVKAIARSSNCQEEFSWPESNSWNIVRIHGQTSLLFPKIFNSTRCQNFRFSTPSWWQRLSWCPFVGLHVQLHGWLRRKSGIYWIISTISFSILCCCWKHPIQAHQAGPTLLKLARSDEIIARKRWQCRRVRDSKRTHYEPHHSPPRWELGVTTVKPRVQTMKPTRELNPI